MGYHKAPIILITSHSFLHFPDTVQYPTLFDYTSDPLFLKGCHNQDAETDTDTDRNRISFKVFPANRKFWDFLSLASF